MSVCVCVCVIAGVAVQTDVLDEDGDDDFLETSPVACDTAPELSD